MHTRKVIKLNDEHLTYKMNQIFYKMLHKSATLNSYKYKHCIAIRAFIKVKPFSWRF